MEPFLELIAATLIASILQFYANCKLRKIFFCYRAIALQLYCIMNANN